MGYFDTKEAKNRLAKFQESFEKSFGDDTLKRGKPQSYSVIPTGSINLDLALGVGGYIEGRIVEIWGQDDAGKTTLAFLGIAEAQRKYPKKLVAYIDVENKVDESWAEALGVNLGQWFVYTPKNAEDVADSLKKFVEDPLFSMVVVDSVGAMMGRVEQEKQAEDAVVAVTARIVTRMVKHATFFAPINGAVVLILNQVRDVIDSYGAKTTTPGGRALKHASTMKIKLSGAAKQAVMATVKGERIPIGKEVAAKVERNKVAPAGPVGMFFLKNVPTEKHGGVGIDKAIEAATVGVKLGIIPRHGNSYVEPTSGEKFVGLDKLVTALQEDPARVEAIRDLLVRLRAPAEIDEEPLTSEPEEAEETEVSEAPEPEQEVTEILGAENTDVYLEME